MPTLTLFFKDNKLMEYSLALGQGCTIGRKKSNDIVVDNLAVSGEHARIEAVATTYVIRDLDSTNGTFVNQERISLHNLRHKDEVQIGKHRLFFDSADLIKQASEADWSAEDKTRILDTSEFKKISGKKEHAAMGKTYADKDKAGLIQKIWRWLVG